MTQDKKELRELIEQDREAQRQQGGCGGCSCGKCPIQTGTPCLAQQNQDTEKESN